MWILIGVLAGIILVKWMNSREKKKRLERQREQNATPQEPYRWMPPEKPDEPLKPSETKLSEAEPANDEPSEAKPTDDEPSETKPSRPGPSD
jgi:type II secretory pathway pseudopilin PulG